MQRIGKGGLAHSAKRLASGLLAVLLISGEVERDEQDQVGAENANTGECGELLTSTFSSIGHVGEVGRCEVSVRSKVNEACVGC